jgi:hypothetical protein
MAFNLPLPSITTNTIPNAMSTLNQLVNQHYQNEIAAVNAKYAPAIVTANANAKNAYANLMGPQFTAKALGNTNILAQLQPDQANAAINRVINAATGQPTSNNILTSQNNLSPDQQGGNGQSWLRNALHSFFGGNVFAPPPQNNNALLQTPTVPAYYQNQQQQNQSPQPGQNQLQPPNQWQSTDNGQVQNQPVVNNPTPSQTINTASNQPVDTSNGQSAINNNSPNTQMAQNTGSYEGTVEQGKEEGKIRADQIKELDDMAFNAQTKQTVLDDLNRMIASPILRQIRQLPLAGQHEIGWYEKEGNPEEKKLIGSLDAQMGNVIVLSAKDFNGQFRKGEQQLLMGMKPNKSDMPDVMIGKAQSLNLMNQMLLARTRLTSQLMNDYKMNKGKAEQLADKSIDINKMRQQIHDTLNPMITLRNKKTKEVVTVPIGDARSKYGYKG